MSLLVRIMRHLRGLLYGLGQRQNLSRLSSSWTQSSVNPSWKRSTSNRPWKRNENGHVGRKSETLEPRRREIPHTSGDALFGIHGVRQALRCNLRMFEKLILHDTNNNQQHPTKKSKSDDDSLKEIKDLALQLGIPIAYER